MKILAFGLLTLIIATQCKPKPSSDKGNTVTSTKPSQKKLATAGFDTITKKFIPGHELMTQDLIELKIIDTSVTSQLSDASYCDTTIQLNDSISYSIISVNDENGPCTYFFLTSLNNKNEKVIASKFLHPDCEVNYSLDTYELHEHLIVSKNKIEVSTITISEKKNRPSLNEEQNIERKQTQRNLITISQTGQIK